MMKWVLWILGVFAVLTAAVFLIGATLPVRHHASRTVTFTRPAEKVWAAITNVQDFPAWRGDVKSVQLLSPAGGKRSWKETGSNGSITYVAEEEVPQSRLVARIANPGLPFGGTWTYLVNTTASGTTLQIKEDGEVYNPLFRFMSRFVLGHAATMDTFLKALGVRLGEAVLLRSP